MGEIGEDITKEKIQKNSPNGHPKKGVKRNGWTPNHQLGSLRQYACLSGGDVQSILCKDFKLDFVKNIQ